MKKALSILLALTLTASLAACGSQNDTPPPASDPPALSEPDSGTPDNTESSTPSAETTDGADQPSGGDGGILIAYFGVPETDGTDTHAQASRVATEDGVVGNTQFIAQAIQEAVGGDLFAIETVQAYPGTHDALLDFAYDELREDARPELADQVQNLEDYDVIFLGYPNWNAELPMPLYTFLESHDLSGKIILPFVTHGGSGFSRTISTIQSLQPEAAVSEDGFSVSRGSVAGAAQDAMDWVADMLN